MNASIVIDDEIAHLSGLMFTAPDQFFEQTKKFAAQLTSNDLPLLRSRFHAGLPIPENVDKASLGLSGWLSACQYTIFELIYHIGIAAVPMLKEVAYGEYDWTQASALEILTRFYMDGKLPVEIIDEIDSNLAKMRYESHLYYAQALIALRRKDRRYETQVIQRIKNEDLHEAIKEIMDVK
ncbi:hypothetical protein [Chitinophaga sancti]|uniref:Uncharacterized protein n=1 Tax=Chitinophaga sancti TaxID=1004 RepID=A0A1K1S125_9BACT|nr:hypothetical protein [Chitinophaga sancti]WQD59720.1 hypothetical protein U0033_17670 [Chitinophaga sancti]WQG88149.1 hypothetical protein SR876_24795 [Chitinophaga sancti]SFW78120.1 hypothetical protein SAMN05661012_04581 [Chitinophaga sancti]